MDRCSPQRTSLSRLYRQPAHVRLTSTLPAMPYTYTTDPARFNFEVIHPLLAGGLASSAADQA